MIADGIAPRQRTIFTLWAALLLGACHSDSPANALPAAGSGMTAPAMSAQSSTPPATASPATASSAPASANVAGAGSSSPAITTNNAGHAGIAAAPSSAAGSGTQDAGVVAQNDASSSNPPGQDMAPDAAAAATGSLPAVSDLEKPGPFTPMRADGPSGYVLVYPQELGKDGVKHPIVSWGPGATENASSFSMLLDHLASHGFAVISYDGTPEGQELITAIDWMVAENDRSGSMFYQKLDATKITAGGHSAGSLATFVVGADKRLTTTLHISGGTFDPHTDIKNLHAPALFICGEPGGDGLLMGDVANPNCEIDFENATVPVFYGVTKGAAHMTPTDIGDSTIRAHQFGAIVGWLRWQLAADASTKPLFVGSACRLCQDAAWSSVKQKSLD